jgi:tripartite-type tricarboxylate transporter receptor subunit TctC
LLKLIEKIDVVHIPYKGGPQGISDTIGGQVPMGVYDAPSVVAHVQGGRLRKPAVTSAITAHPPAPDRTLFRRS